MKTIIPVNTELPTINRHIEYNSEESLQDYDIIIFDPSLPHFNRVEFTAGGSCITIEGSKRLLKLIKHWSRELLDALKEGKTIFFVLNEHEEDSISLGSTSPKKHQHTYSTSSINNYQVLPKEITVRNSSGQLITIKDKRFSQLAKALDKISQYRVIIESTTIDISHTTKNGKGVLGGLVKFDDLPGNLILLPYFDLSEMVDYDEKKDEETWTKKALGISETIVEQILALDKVLCTEKNTTPTPPWIKTVELPKQVDALEDKILGIENKIKKLQENKAKKINDKNDLLRYTTLLYENSKILEASIEDCLILLGYKVENYRKGDVEIDHIMVGPSGVRMIGESEGKDNSAINISKFRQLESNIGEDFEREDIETPAKGILFGNGYRLTDPKKRQSQFTEKCITNAKRLRTALIKTTDLYDVVVHVLDNPGDEEFKKSCRDAIEKTEGEIVSFPQITK